MSNPGEAEDLFIRSRTALLDALEALDEHRGSVIVIGAQAVYLRTAEAQVSIAEATKDSDLALDPRSLGDTPLIEKAMIDAGFERDPQKNQPGAWLSKEAIPVDLMVPDLLAGNDGSRGARIPPHHKHATRRAKGLEAALVDNGILEISSLRQSHPRQSSALVAGPAALAVAKLHKIGERADNNPERLVDKDAHDLYRILVATPTSELASRFKMLRTNDLAGAVTEEAIALLESLFADGPTALGSMMAGRTEEGIGEPETVSNQVSILATDLVEALRQ